MKLTGMKGLCIAALAGIASVAAAPARADGDAVARIEVGFSTAYRASTFAAQMVGKPYRTGGAAPATGFDCSGLVQFSFRQAGVILPRSTAQQRHAAERVRVSHLRHGDLVFFDLQGKKNSHVGIYVGDGQFVHAPSTGKRVRKDRLDSPFWRKHLSEARRFDALDV
jgi:cell wall-associated NlpC family hydrolase